MMLREQSGEISERQAALTLRTVGPSVPDVTLAVMKCIRFPVGVGRAVAVLVVVCPLAVCQILHRVARPLSGAVVRAFGSLASISGVPFEALANAVLTFAKADVRALSKRVSS